MQETLANHAENGLPEGKSTMVGFGKCRFDVSIVCGECCLLFCRNALVRAWFSAIATSGVVVVVVVVVAVVVVVLLLLLLMPPVVPGMQVTHDRLQTPEMPRPEC